MPSKIWTIVCVTLTLLLFGCSDAELAKVNNPLQPVAAGTSSDVHAVAVEAPVAGLRQSEPRMEPDFPEAPRVPNFDPGVGIAGKTFGDRDARGSGKPSGSAFGDRGASGEAELPELPGFHATDKTRAALPKLNNYENRPAAEGTPRWNGNGQVPGTPPQLPGVEGGSQVGLHQLPLLEESLGRTESQD